MSTPECDIAVALDLELPEGEISLAELDLIEGHFADLLRQVIVETDTERA